jgi:Sulfotransferase family
MRGVSSRAALERMYKRERMRRSRANLLQGLYVDHKRDYRDSIFLAGTGRSGTTWVSDIINYKNEYRYVFEPFHRGKVKLCRSFRRKQYLRPDDRREEFLLPARIILSGALRRHYWADLFNGGYVRKRRVIKDVHANRSLYWGDRLDRGFVPGRRLIKEVRANLMLGWIRANFPEMPIVFLLRHPCAVAHSKTKLGWTPNLDNFLSQRDLMEDFLEPFEKEMRSAKTDFERHVFSWCVESYVPLKQLSQEEIHLIFYERLCKDPKGEVGRLFAYLGANFDKSVFEKMNNPSSLSRKASTILSGEKRVVDWSRHVTDAQLERTAEILGPFGLDEIYSEEALPNPSGALSLMRNCDAKASPEPERESL